MTAVNGSRSHRPGQGALRNFKSESLSALIWVRPADNLRAELRADVRPAGLILAERHGYEILKGIEPFDLVLQLSQMAPPPKDQILELVETALTPILLHCAHHRIRFVGLAIITDYFSVSIDVPEVEYVEVLRCTEIAAHPRTDQSLPLRI